LRIVTKWLRRHLAFAVGLLYLSLIPAFAGLYVWLGPAFYHSTVRLEAALDADAEALKPRWQPRSSVSSKRPTGRLPGNRRPIE
jgi:hypothetical protein